MYAFSQIGYLGVVDLRGVLGLVCVLNCIIIVVQRGREDVKGKLFMLLCLGLELLKL